MPDVYFDLDLPTALKASNDPEAQDLLRELNDRVESCRQEMQRFREWCDRADKLYYAEEFTDGGADLWADDPSAYMGGRSHVSINTPATYVDVPASLQSYDPIENMLATSDTEEARTAAAALERVYTAWKQEDGFDLKFAKACAVKALYGRTAGRVYWDKAKKRPSLDVIEQPRNLYLGYRTDSYEKVEWAASIERWHPNALIEEYGLDVDAREIEGKIIPFVSSTSIDNMPSRTWLNFGPARIEVWDYWYRRRNAKGKMETWNVVFAGNAILQGPNRYPEYEGDIPFVPLYNTFVPGTPNGRAELYDMEQLIREKYEKVTAGSQMIAAAVAGDFWQLVGAEAPTRVPQGLKPKRNEVIAPGPGNRIEAIQPFVAQFQLEQFLTRIDREAATISGLNDLLLGLAPPQVLSSSKAINALVSNYETRLTMRRMLLYKWRKDVWELAERIFRKKSKEVAEIVSAGGGRLEIIDPSLNPRDELETATRAGNLVAAKLWSQRRGMDAVGVDDPETEQDLIREERTDATMFPEEVQVMAQLMSVIQSLGLGAPQGVPEQIGGQVTSGQSALRRALGERTPQNSTSSQLEGDQGITPPIPGVPQEAGGAPLPFAMSQQGGASAPLGQTMIQGGKAKSRILTQQQLGRR
jgi:hypothetical protein